jgi:beta-glucosidase
MKRITLFLALALSACTGIFAQSAVTSAKAGQPKDIPRPIYKDPTRPIENRVRDLLSRMTPEEKFWQLFMIPGEIPAGQGEKYRNGIFGFQVSAAQRPGEAQMLNYSVSDDAKTLRDKINTLQKYFVDSSRLGIPMIAFDEALHGLVRGGATVFPQAIALSATWDTALVGRVASAIAAEARIRGIRDILSPVINIAADPRWGRVEETYGEDPLLVSAMGVSFVSAFGHNGVITTPKHFIANVGDGGRDSYPIHANERWLDEEYFPPFIACIQKGGSRSVMTAYNSLDGTPCSANSWLLTKKLKTDWGFKGFVISDANAVGGANVLHFTSPDIATSGQQAIDAGLDVIFQTAYEHYKLYIPPFLDGRIDTNRINDAVSRVLSAKFELGLFEHPYVTDTDLNNWGNTKTHKALAEQAALESIVLLKNTSTLPLKKTIHSIAVIGPDATEARLGGYSGPGNGKISILEGLRERAGKSIHITYTPGCGRRAHDWSVIPAAQLRLTGEYFDNLTLTGQPVVTRTDADINFQWTLSTPAKGLGHDFYSVRWTGTLHAPKTGRYNIGLDGNDGYRLYLNGKLLIDNWEKRSYSTILKEIALEQGHDYPIRVEFFEPAGNAHLKLIWDLDAAGRQSHGHSSAGTQDPSQAQIDSAVNAASKADVAIVVAGITEGEFQDRASLALPGRQEELIRKVSATGKPVIVLLVGGSAITMSSWLDDVASVMAVWYPGEEGGRAIAKVLFGDYDPAGRLPISYPIAEAQLPWVYNHLPTGRGDDYNNLTGLPLFPFGYGLSYTRFDYSDAHLEKTEMSDTDSTTLTCTIKNSGAHEGDEVVQLYLRELVSSMARPVIALKGFQRIHLQPGDSKTVSFVVSPEMLMALDKDLHPVVEQGTYQLMIGASSRDLRLKTLLKIR